MRKRWVFPGRGKALGYPSTGYELGGCSPSTNGAWAIVCEMLAMEKKETGSSACVHPRRFASKS